MNSAEERVFGYLIQFIGSLSDDELRLFIRFVTGSSVVAAEQILVTFNTADGLNRRPISHTCNPTIEISSTYPTYPDFAHDFHSVLKSEYGWIMDAF